MLFLGSNSLFSFFIVRRLFLPRCGRSGLSFLVVCDDTLLTLNIVQVNLTLFSLNRKVCMGKETKQELWCKMRAMGACSQLPSRRPKCQRQLTNPHRGFLWAKNAPCFRGLRNSLRSNSPRPFSENSTHFLNAVEIAMLHPNIIHFVHQKFVKFAKFVVYKIVSRK